jgi:phosphoglycerate dehydrogenase-like enzyme
MMVDVLCLRPKIDFERVDALPSSALNIIYRAPDDSDVPELMNQARALVIPAVGPKLDASLFDRTQLQLVQVTGAGLDRLDRSALKRAGIPVANVPGGSNQAVAEYAVTTATVLLRQFAWSSAAIHDGNYVEVRARMVRENLAGLDGLLVGIVGFGVIGVAVAEAFQKWGCRICYYDPAPSNPKLAQTMGAQSVSLSELLETSDVVSLHVPLLPATKGLIGAAQLAKMKAGAILVQAARGGIVDEEALALDLQSGHLGGAAVDVYSTEPPTMDNPLLALNGEAARRLLLTPHVAGVTRQSAALLFRSAWKNVERVLISHEAPLNRVY